LLIKYYGSTKEKSIKNSIKNKKKYLYCFTKKKTFKHN
jgi:hypothetical protein